MNPSLISVMLVYQSLSHESYQTESWVNCCYYMPNIWQVGRSNYVKKKKAQFDRAGWVTTSQPLYEGWPKLSGMQAQLYLFRTARVLNTIAVVSWLLFWPVDFSVCQRSHIRTKFSALHILYFCLSNFVHASDNFAQFLWYVRPLAASGWLYKHKTEFEAYNVILQDNHISFSKLQFWLWESSSGCLAVFPSSDTPPKNICHADTDK